MSYGLDDSDSNALGSIDLWFGTEPPARREKNWIPARARFVLIRFHGPLEPFVDKTRKPDEIETVRGGSALTASRR